MAVDRYSHSSRAIHMDGRGSPLITAEELKKKAQLCMFNCFDNYIMLVFYIRHPKREVL